MLIKTVGKKYVGQGKVLVAVQIPHSVRRTLPTVILCCIFGAVWALAEKGEMLFPHLFHEKCEKEGKSKKFAKINQKRVFGLAPKCWSKDKKLI